MRLRNATVAALGAFTLLLAVPSSASAADGEFDYTYGTNGTSLQGALLDPAYDNCINIADATDLAPARAPYNRTNAPATVFLESDCNGDTFSTMNPGKKLGDTTLFRSVIFSSAG
ncbi:hypothetical protein ACGFXC_34590 [Streptomyces sp. NPDC048507]|uniref:hypothetical protein n=1 Tax=Streptomyces sp. NPDC048507 TaxID=3365560 RepID=UPI00371C261A